MRAFYDDEELMLRELAAELAAAFAVRTPHDLERFGPTSGWKELASSGLLGLRLRPDGEPPEGSGVAVQLVAAAFGGALGQAPFLESATLPIQLLATAAPELAAEIAEGSGHYGLLLSPDLSRLASEDDVLGGRAVGWGTTTAEHALFLRGSDRDLARLALASSAPTVSVDLTRPLMRMGPVAASEIESLDHRLSEDEYSSWLALTLVGVCADAQGAMRAATQVAVDYAKDRQAFGKPIGAFQALQHILADDFVMADALETTTNYAAWAVDAASPTEALLAARTAKAYLGQVGRRVVEDAMQVFGGIGQTWEHIAHVYTRRVLLDQQLFGGEQAQLRTIAELRLGTGAAISDRR
jgi:alkylation response protein AidB-like acyl-CoA dehydrogenase